MQNTFAVKRLNESAPQHPEMETKSGTVVVSKPSPNVDKNMTLLSFLSWELAICLVNCTSFRDFIRCPNLILKHPLPFLTMKANSQSPRHYKKLKSDTWQPWERLWMLLISSIKVSHPWPHMNMFPQTQKFFFQLSAFKCFQPEVQLLLALPFLWSSFYDPIFLYWY